MASYDGMTRGWISGSFTLENGATGTNVVNLAGYSWAKIEMPTGVKGNMTYRCAMLKTPDASLTAPPLGTPQNLMRDDATPLSITNIGVSKPYILPIREEVFPTAGLQLVFTSAQTAAKRIRIIASG